MPQVLAANIPNKNPCTKGFEPFSFAFLTDCHLTSHLSDNYMLLQESQLFLQDAVKQINLLQPDFVVFGGDQVQGVGDDDVNWQLFLDIAQYLDCPWYFVLGETDIAGNFVTDKMRTFGRDWKGRGLNNSQPYWSCDPICGVHLIGLDTSQANLVDEFMDQNQIDWLKNDIGQEGNRLNIVVSHHPLFDPGHGYQDKDHLLLKGNVVSKIFEAAASPVICLSGHNHISKIEKSNNISWISSPSLDIYPCAFRFFKINAEELAVETYQVNFPALIKKAKTNLLNSDFAHSLSSVKNNDFLRLVAGSKSDQNNKFPLRTIKSD